MDEDLEELFLEIEELLTRERKNYWEHQRLDWDQHVQKLILVRTSSMKVASTLSLPH